MNKEFPRILIGDCPKCKGALREQIDPGEWSCINCGELVLDFPLPAVSLNTKKEPELPVAKEEVKEEIQPEIQPEEQEETLAERTERSLLDIPALMTILGSEEDIEEGDDSEWESLTTITEGKES